MKEKTKMAYYKVLDTIKSCKTNEQISVAVHLIRVFINRFKNDIGANEVEMITDTLAAQHIAGSDNTFAAEMIRIYCRHSGSNKSNPNLFKVFKFEDHIINHPYQIK